MSNATRRVPLFLTTTKSQVESDGNKGGTRDSNIPCSPRDSSGDPLPPQEVSQLIRTGQITIRCKYNLAPHVVLKLASNRVDWDIWVLCHRDEEPCGLIAKINAVYRHLIDGTLIPSILIPQPVQLPPMDLDEVYPPVDYDSMTDKELNELKELQEQFLSQRDVRVVDIATLVYEPIEATGNTSVVSDMDSKFEDSFFEENSVFSVLDKSVDTSFETSFEASFDKSETEEES
ncbi:hypothetical protein D9758_017839 [Tetrapyrgos nigripes]|uniref:Uncharacterized protein n=1 Tax=Tetrapyrgos nigripes TaxID=182062 RepID=A0A8H5F944_9AGAR|nr:hypothetical protein D9758_017839 [Tetrapyrgos nigripes]